MPFIEKQATVELNSHTFHSPTWWVARVKFWEAVINDENLNLSEAQVIMSSDKQSLEARDLSRVAKDRIRNADINLKLALNRI